MPLGSCTSPPSCSPSLRARGCSSGCCKPFIMAGSGRAGASKQDSGGDEGAACCRPSSMRQRLVHACARHYDRLPTLQLQGCRATMTSSSIPSPVALHGASGAGKEGQVSTGPAVPSSPAPTRTPVWLRMHAGYPEADLLRSAPPPPNLMLLTSHAPPCPNHPAAWHQPVAACWRREPSRLHA